MTASNFCANCGAQRSGESRFCPSCGQAFAPQAGMSAPRPRKRRSNPLIVIVLGVLVTVGVLYLLNNTMAGISIKCHVLGDYGACLIESFSDPGPVQDILEDIGNSV